MNIQVLILPILATQRWVQNSGTLYTVPSYKCEEKDTPTTTPTHIHIHTHTHPPSLPPTLTHPPPPPPPHTHTHTKQCPTVRER